MDLKIKDVAELLNVSETTVRRWLAEEKIPAYRLGNQFRFSRIEIENWVMNRKMGKEQIQPNPFSQEKIKLNAENTNKLLSKRIGTQAFSLYRAIYKGGVIESMPGNTKEEIILSSVQVIANNLGVDADVLAELLIDRENLMPTALNHGVGVPHTRDFLLQKPLDVVTVVYPKNPIEYGALDGKKVNVLFFLFACEDKRHLHLLAKIAHLTRNEDALAFFAKRPKHAQVLEFIKKWEAEIKQPEFAEN